MAGALGYFVGSQIFGVIFAWAGAAAVGSALGVLSPTPRAIAASSVITLIFALIGFMMYGLTLEGVIQFGTTWFISGVIAMFLVRRDYLKLEAQAKTAISDPYDRTIAPEPTFRRKLDISRDETIGPL